MLGLAVAGERQAGELGRGQRVAAVAVEDAGREGDAGGGGGDVDRQHGVGIDLGERRVDVEGDRGVLIAAGGTGGERRGIGDRGGGDLGRGGGGGGGLGSGGG